MKTFNKILKIPFLFGAFLLILKPVSGTEWHVAVNGKGYTYNQYICKQALMADYIAGSNPYQWRDPYVLEYCPGPGCSSCTPYNENGALPNYKYTCQPCGDNEYGKQCVSKYPAGVGGNGLGTLANPWSLEFALSNPPDPGYITASNCCDLAAQNSDGSYKIRRWIQPGDIIWVHGGDYTGYQATIYGAWVEVYNVPRMYTSYLEGTVESPIIVRAYPCEKPVINSTGKFAAYMQYWDKFNEYHTGIFYDAINNCCNDTIKFKNPNYTATSWIGNTNIPGSTITTDNLNRILNNFNIYRPTAALQITGGNVEFWDIEIKNNTTSRNSRHGYIQQYEWWFVQDAFNDIYNPGSPNYCAISCPALDYFDFGDGVHVGGAANNYTLDYPQYTSSKNVKLINMNIHDNLGCGIQAFDEAENHVINGCIVYNNGFNTSHNTNPLPPKPHYKPLRGGNFHPGGHGMYLHNQFNVARRSVKQNIVFQNAAAGLDLWAGSAGDIYNYDVDENICFNSGSIFLKYHSGLGWNNGESWNFFIGGAHGYNFNIRKNHFIMSNLIYPMSTPTGPTRYISGCNTMIGYEQFKEMKDFTITDNHVIGGGNNSEGALQLSNPKNVLFQNNTIQWEGGYAINLVKKHHGLACPQLLPHRPYDEINVWNGTKYYYSVYSCIAPTCSSFRYYTHVPDSCALEGNPLTTSNAYYKKDTIFFYTYSNWKTQFTDIDMSSTMSFPPSTDELVYINNNFDPGRVQIQAYDWNGSQDVQINLNGIIPSGRAFTIKNAQDPANNLIAVPANYTAPFYVPTQSNVAQPNGVGLTGNPNYMVNALTTGPAYGTYVVEFFPYNVTINVGLVSTCDLHIEIRDANNNLINSGTWYKTLTYSWSKVGDPTLCNTVPCDKSTFTAPGPGVYQVTIKSPTCQSITLTYEITSCAMTLTAKKTEEELQQNKNIDKPVQKLDEERKTPADERSIAEVNYLQATPNPFENGVNISYGLNKAGALKIFVTDAAGKIIETVVDQKQEAGNYEVRALDKRNLSPGLYFVVMSYEGKLMKQKMIKQ